MNILGIETSCDETAAAVVKDGLKVCSTVVSSSLNLHKKYGGIIPEIAFRKQLETITIVVDHALKDAGVCLKNIDLISVTDGPGFLGSLLVGVSFAKSLSFSRNIPFLGVNHLYSHIYACFLNSKVIDFPFVALVVSGGHTSLYHLRDWDKIDLLGSTCDDACGEAFDKAAKILNLGYPGGPIIGKLAQSGDPGKIIFACSNTQNPLDFSFSGIKTAVLYYARKNKKAPVADICASFQEAVINILVEKSLLACALKNTSTLVVGGGVAANSALREKLNFQANKLEDNGLASDRGRNARGNVEAQLGLTFSQSRKPEGNGLASKCQSRKPEGNGLASKCQSRKKRIKVLFPRKEFCMDNAAMVAGLGYWLFKKGKKSG